MHDADRRHVNDVPLHYERASTLDEALASIWRGATAIAGGTIVAPSISHGGLRGSFVDLGSVRALHELKTDERGLHIGALVTIERLLDTLVAAGAHEALANAARSIGNPQIRAAGTIGGNVACRLARASLPVALIALDARVQVESRVRRESFEVEALLREGLPEGALVTSVTVAPQADRRARYVKFAWRHSTAKALAAVAVSLRFDGGRVIDPCVAVSGICVARRIREAERLLVGAKLDDATIAAAARVAGAEVPYAVDVDAPPVGEAYRRRLVTEGVTTLLRDLARA